MSTGDRSQPKLPVSKFFWLLRLRSSADWTKRVRRSRRVSRSIRPTPSLALAPYGRQWAPTRPTWFGPGAFWKACAKPGSRRSDPDRRLAAILAADVVGYSRLMGEDEAGRRGLRACRLDEAKAELAEGRRLNPAITIKWMKEHSPSFPAPFRRLRAYSFRLTPSCR